MGPGKIRIDSREVQPGDVFVAIRGGVRFVPSALERGASLCVVPEGSGYSDGERILCVRDTVKYLWEKTRQRRARFSGTVIGITGSAGKTTFKEMLVYALTRKAKRISFTPGNRNNQIGLPLAVCNADLEADFWVLELGTSAPGEIRALADLVRPDYAVITSVYPSHLEGLGSVSDVAREKSDIFAGVRKGFVPVRFFFALEEFVHGYPVHWVGAVKEETFPLPGEHYRDLLGLISALGKEIGIPDLVSVDWGKFEVPKGRFRVIEGKDKRIVDDSYNANPGSMKASLSSFKELIGEGESVGLVLGDMLELGTESQKYHRDIVAFTQYMFPSAIKVFVGREFSKAVEYEGIYAHCFEDWRGYEEEIARILSPAKWIFVKGSRGIGLDGLLELWV